MIAAVAQERVRLSGQRHQAIAVTHFRLMVMMLLFIGVTGIVCARIGYLSLFAGHQLGGPTADGLVPERADIVDRNGVPLARNIDAWSIAIHPNKIIGDPALLAYRLAELMPEHDEAWYRTVLASRKSFHYLARRATPELVQKVNALGEPGIEFPREPERLYPQATLASHVLGWIDQGGHAASGMEKVLDARLSDPRKRAEPVALAIDSRVQTAMESALDAQMVKHSAIGAAGLVMDVDTGEIVAMASLPTFNPNSTGQVPYETFINKAVTNVYELGSTFKMLTIANAIQSGVITDMAKRYDATQNLHVGGYTIHDDHPTKRWLNTPELLVHSSNIATARVADELGAARTQAFFRQVGFDKPVPFELGAKGRPLWPKYWARTTVMTAAYGHGIAVTPLHLANAYAALVNGGILRRPTMLKVAPGARVPGVRVISQATSDRMRQLMRLVVLKGTGRKAEAPGLRVGGKTGTAEKADKGGYNKHANVSTFAGVFPMDHPRYVVIAMLDSPKGTADTYGHTEAAWVAGPVINKVVSRIGPLLGIIPDERADVDVSQLLPLLFDDRAGDNNVPE